MKHIFICLLLAHIAFAQKATPLRGSVNTPKYNEYAPSISSDGETLVFQSDRIDGRDTGWQLYESNLQPNGLWGEPRSINAINNYGIPSDLIGGPSISYDGNTLYFFAYYNESFSDHEDIYFSARDDDGWSEPLNLGKPINTSDYEGFPSVSADGKTLYFIRGNYENSDTNVACYKIMVSKRGRDGRWQEPQALPEPVNVSCEKAPRIMADSKTLIFSSNREGGKGGFDLYKSVLEDDGSWSEPVNLSFANTKKDDQFVSIPPCGDIMYFVNNADIYTTPVPDNLRPNQMVTIQGFITDSISRKPVKSIVKAIQKQSQYNAEVGNNRTDGRYSLLVHFNKSYTIEVSQAGYKPQKITVLANKLNNCATLNLNIKLVSDKYEPKPTSIIAGQAKPIVETKVADIGTNFGNLKKGQVIQLDKIYFDQGSYVLRPISYEQLDYLVLKLKQKLRLVIEVGGHTDDVGDLRLNLALSENRAKIVANYLINNGIDEDRISYKGYGHTRPVAPNFTEPNRKKNRRVEFIVLTD